MRKLILLSLCLFLSLLAQDAGAQNYYWDNNGAGTPGSGTWDIASPNWSTTSALTASPTTFAPGGTAVFCAGTSAAGSITVAVETAISANGVYNNGVGGTPCALTLTSQTGNGSLSLPSGLNTFYVTSAASNTAVNIPINGPGGLQTGGVGTLYLNAANNYSGGTTLASAALVYFNNGSAFGTGPITPALGGYAALLSAGGSVITLPNNFVIPSASQGINFASSASTPVVCTGTWDLQYPFLLRNNGNSTAPLTLSGVISDVGALTISANNSGAVLLSGNNTYSGGTSIIQGSTGVTVQLGNSNAMGTGATTVASGCILDLNGTANVNAALTINGSGGGPGAMLNSSATPASLSSSSTLALGNGGQNYIGGTGNITLNCPMTSVGNQNFVKIGTGTLTLNAACSYGTGICYVGGTGQGAGTLAIGNAGALGTSTLNMNISPATVQSSTATSYSFNNPLTLGAAGTSASTPSLIFGAPGTGNLSFSGAGNTGTTSSKTIEANGITVTFSGVLSGATTAQTLGFAGINNGVIVLSGANTYTKPNNIYSGTVQVAHAEATGTSGPLGKSAAVNHGNIVLYGGTLQYSSANNYDYSGRFHSTLPQSYNIDVNGQPVTFASALTSSSGALTLSDTAGGGTLTLSAANTYGGGTTVNAGTLNVTGSIPGNVTVNGGVLELGNPSALSSSATVSLGAGVPVQLNYSGTQNISALYINGFQAPAGVYGASPAYNPGGIFSGLGTFTVGNGPASVTISSETIVNNQLVISWNSAAGENYNVYSTTNLSLPLSSWTLVNSSGPITAASGSTSYTLPGNVSSQPALFITVQQ